MKFFICFALALACTSAATIPQLADDLAELNALIPNEKIALLVEQYMYSDAGFRDTRIYLSTEEFKAYWEKAINTPEFTVIVDYLAHSGYDLPQIVNGMAASLDLPLYKGPIPEVTQARSTMGFFEALLNTLPKKKIQEFIKERVNTSPVFRFFYERVTSQAFAKLVLNFFANPELQDFWRALNDHGYYPLEILGMIVQFLGLKY